MAYTTQYDLALDATFQKKAHQAMVRTCIAVQGEATNTPNHQPRSAFAREVLLNQNKFLAYWAQGLTGDDGIASNSNDATIQSRSDAIFNAYALIT